jgi:hypothetical protein
MGDLRATPLVTPLVAMLAATPEHFAAARPALEEVLGPVEVESSVYPFDKTNYYASTMGPHVVRAFYAFKRLADPAGLADWKTASNKLEATLRLVLAPSGDPVRPINLDPGYIAGSKLVLASTKPFAHRLYLRDGIYGEITMNFRGSDWIGHQFTFPDFRNGTYDAFFKRVRDRHLKKVKRVRRGEEIE